MKNQGNYISYLPKTSSDLFFIAPRSRFRDEMSVLSTQVVGMNEFSLLVQFLGSKTTLPCWRRRSAVGGGGREKWGRSLSFFCLLLWENLRDKLVGKDCEEDK